MVREDDCGQPLRDGADSEHMQCGRHESTSYPLGMHPLYHYLHVCSILACLHTSAKGCDRLLSVCVNKASSDIYREGGFLKVTASLSHIRIYPSLIWALGVTQVT